MQMIGFITIAFLAFSFSCLGQEDKNGTIKVKKAESDGIIALEPIPLVNTPLTIAEQMPAYLGGQQMMNAFIQKNVKYPEAERTAGIQGTVYVTFVVKPDGRLSNIRILKGISGGSGLDNEALRIVKLMPKWTPGRQNGNVVDVAYTLPIKFEL